MTSVRALVLCPLLAVLAATPALAREKKPGGSARSSSKSSEAKRPQMEERSDPKGFTLKVPGTTSEKRDDWTTTYSARLLPDAAVVKATVSVEALDELTPVTNLDKAVEAVLAARPRGMQATISEQRDLPGGGYLVIIGPEYDTYAVDVIRNGKEVQVKAHCTGPASRLEELKEMCLSVKPTK